MPGCDLPRVATEIEAGVEQSSYDDSFTRHRHTTEHAAIAFNLALRPCGFPCIVRQLHRWPALHRHQFANQADRVEFGLPAGMAPAKIIRQQSPPPGAKPYPPMEILMQPQNIAHIQPIRSDQALSARITSPA